MGHNVQLSSLQGLAQAHHRLEARAHSEYLSAVARGVTRDELLILGLTRELSLLQRDAGEASTASDALKDSTSHRETLFDRCLSMFGLLPTSA